MRKWLRFFASPVSPLLAIGALALFAPAARADAVTPPPVPDDIKVDPAFHAFLVGNATGSQNYVCLPAGTGFAWSLFTPEATLFKDEDRQLITHFNSPNPDEANAIRPTWQDSRDTSTVWASPVKASTDEAFVARNAIPWVLLKVTGARTGPDGGDALTSTKFIQRLNTAGGVAPATGCASAADVGARAFVPYTADYFFYTGP